LIQSITSVAAASNGINWSDLGLSPVALAIGPFELRWYSLAYLGGIILGWWYLMKLIAQPGAPMAKRHVDDMVFYATLGIILGGRLAYVLFYDPSMLSDPVEILKLWQGGMSFHGGVIGVSLGILYLAWKNKLNWLRIHDYVACVVPIGLLLGRLANFVNAELWGSPTTLPWGVVFPGAGPEPRHPSQLYEGALEGIVLFLVLSFLFWKTQARYEPGKLVGTFLLGYGLARFTVEFVREPDRQLVEFAQATGLHMGQWLSLPMILAGLFLVLTARRRRQRVEPIAGSESIA
jgi:phosphatidylglycerol:prolipoprotein diacylglycerol transferase